MPGLLIAGPDVTLGLDRVLGVADGEAGWAWDDGTAGRREPGLRTGPVHGGYSVAAFLVSTRNEIERFVTDWESRESAHHL